MAYPILRPARDLDLENVLVINRLSYLSIRSMHELPSSAKSIYASSIITIDDLLYSRILMISDLSKYIPVGALGLAMITPPLSVR